MHVCMCVCYDMKVERDYLKKIEVCRKVVWRGVNISEVIINIYVGNISYC